MRQWQWATFLIRSFRVDFQIGIVVDIGLFPLRLVAFELTTVTNKWSFWCKRQHLGFLTNPVVIHPLRVFGVAYQPTDVELAVDLEFVTYDTYYRNVLTGPIVTFKHFIAVVLDVFHLLNGGFSFFDRGKLRRVQSLGLSQFRHIGVGF